MSLKSAVLGGLGGFLSGGPGGAIAGVAGSLFGGRSGPPAPGYTGGGGGGGASVGAGGNIGPFSFGYGVSYAGGGLKPGANGACPKGYHLNKHPLAASKHHGAVPARSLCVRNRRVNPLNSRALSRSLRRLHRAQKLVRHLHVLPTHRKRKV